MVSEVAGSNVNLMDIALKEAALAADRGEVPVGCVIIDTKSGSILTKSGNRVEETKDPTAHAEILAIRKATSIIGSKRLPHCDLYVTLEPCPMCATAISFARIRRLYFGAFDEKSGVSRTVREFSISPRAITGRKVYGGIGESSAAALLNSFFAERR